jgi:hypothetical protein
MKRIILVLTSFLFSMGLLAQNNEIELLVRADDIGSFHSANDYL